MNQDVKKLIFIKEIIKKKLFIGNIALILASKRSTAENLIGILKNF